MFAGRGEDADLRGWYGGVERSCEVYVCLRREVGAVLPSLTKRCSDILSIVLHCCTLSSQASKRRRSTCLFEQNHLF